MTTLIPAFVLSELKTAFIIGFVIFIPFLIIDLDRELDADVDGHVHAPTGARVAAVQAAAVRDGRRLGAHRQLAHHELPPLSCATEAKEPPVTDSAVINIAVQSILLATKLAAPILGVVARRSAS